MIELIFKPKGKPQRNIELNSAQVVTVGRDKQQVDIHLPEVEVSRRQCRFSVVDGRVAVEPIKGSGPIFLNRTPLTKKAVLRDKDFVAFGNYRVYPHYPAGKTTLKKSKLPASSQPSAFARLAQRLTNWSTKTPRRRAKIQASAKTLEQLQRAALDWNAHGRPARLLLRGRASRQAVQFEFNKSELGNDVDLVTKYVHESAESLRTSRVKLGLNVLTLCIASGAGTLTAHAVTRDLEMPPPAASRKTCSDADVEQLRTQANSAAGDLMGMLQVTYDAEKRNCGPRTTDIETSVRELLRAKNHQVFAPLTAAPQRIAFSPDEGRVAALVDGTLTVFSRGNPEPKIFVDKTISSFAWSPDGRLITAHDGGDISIWEAQRAGWRETQGEAHKGEVVSIATGRQGGYFASLSKGEVHLWGLRGSQRDQKIDRASFPGKPVQVLLDGQERSVVVQTTKSIYVWDIGQDARFGERTQLQTSATPIALALAADGRTIVASDEAGTLHRFQRNNNRWKRRTIYSASQVTSLIAYSAKHESVVVVDGRSVYRLAGETDREMLPSAHLGDTAGEVEQLLLSASEDIAVTIGDKGAELWDVARGTQNTLGRISTASRWKSAELSPGHDKLLAADGKNILVWDLPPQSSDSLLLAKHGPPPKFTGSKSQVRPHLPIAAGSEVTVLTTAETSEPKIIAWNTTKTGIPTRDRRVYGPNHHPTVIALSQTGQFIASANKSEVQIWRASSPIRPERTRTFPPTGNLKFLAFAGDRRLVAASDTEVVAWGLDSAKQAEPWSVDDGTILTLQASEEHIAVGLKTQAQKGRVIVWNVFEQEKPVYEDLSETPIANLLLANEGSWLVVGGQNGQLNTWQLERKEKGNSYHIGTKVTALDFSATSGTPLVAVGGDNGLLAIFPASGDIEDKIRQNGAISSPVNGLAFGPHPNSLIAAYQNGGLIKWYADRGEWTNVPLGEHPSVTAMAAPRSGNIVFTLSGGGGAMTTVQVWAVDAGSLWEHACAVIGPECTPPRRR